MAKWIAGRASKGNLKEAMEVCKNFVHELKFTVRKLKA